VNRKISKKKLIEKDIARQRIKILINKAIENYKKDPIFSVNCIKIAFAIKKKYNLKFPYWFRSMYCKKCYHLVFQGKVRIRGKGKNIKIITTCPNCGKIIRKELSKSIRFKLAQED